MVQGSFVPWMRYSVSLLALHAERIIGIALHADAALQCTMRWRSLGFTRRKILHG